jgi:hypothetical protein
VRNQDGEKLDEADKEAARALRGKKKKKKKIEVPFLQQKWVQAVGILAVLGVMALGVYLALRPPSPDKLFAAIERAETQEARLEAATKFLDVHGAKGGERVDKAAAVFRDATVKAREKQLANRFQSNLSKPTEEDDPEAYSAAWDAMVAEKAGHLETAEASWQKAKARFPEEAKLTYATGEQLARARWGWVADKRLADIVTARADLARVKQKIDASRPIEQPLKTDHSSPESLAIRAVRLSNTFGDVDRAARVCDSLISLTEKDPEKHTWYLVGTHLKSQLAKAPMDPLKERARILGEWLDKAQKEAEDLKSDPESGAARRDVRNKCRDVTELYGEDTDGPGPEAVKRANKIAAMIPKT